MEVKRIHNTDNKLIFPQTYNQDDTWVGKPNGLWYGINDSWNKYCKTHFPEWIYKNNFELILSIDNMLILQETQDIEVFSSKFSKVSKNNENIIDWKEVSKIYQGIEIFPYTKNKVRFEKGWLNKNPWYDAWEVSSGCLFTTQAIKQLNRLRI